jgi:tetratricopeptide (TPR) repeat protein
MGEDVSPRAATLLEEAQTHYARGEIDAAIPKFCMHLNSDFFDADTLFMLGTCFQAKGMNGLSAVILSAAVDANVGKKKRAPEALLNLGGAYRAEHQNDIAERIWKDALRQETVPFKRAQILGNISGLYVNEGQPEKAIEYCDLALKEDPNFRYCEGQPGHGLPRTGALERGLGGLAPHLRARETASRGFTGHPGMGWYAGQACDRLGRPGHRRRDFLRRIACAIWRVRAAR